MNSSGFTRHDLVYPIIIFAVLGLLVALQIAAQEQNKSRKARAAHEAETIAREVERHECLGALLAWGEPCEGLNVHLPGPTPNS